jgi:hypothetical protein
MRTDVHLPPDVRFFIFPLLFIAIPSFVPLLIARFSGWTILARRFRETSTFTGQSWGWKSARMRWKMNYNNCLKIGADQAGLSMAMAFLFRMGHPALFVPWHEVTIRRRFKVFFRQYIEFELGREERIPFAVDAKLAESLQMAAGINWPAEVRT